MGDGSYPQKCIAGSYGIWEEDGTYRDFTAPHRSCFQKYSPPIHLNLLKVAMRYGKMFSLIYLKVTTVESLNFGFIFKFHSRGLQQR